MKTFINFENLINNYMETMTILKNEYEDLIEAKKKLLSIQSEVLNYRTDFEIRDEILSDLEKRKNKKEEWLNCKKSRDYLDKLSI
jgi:cell division FtsZ-interacting protein ZapD